MNTLEMWMDYADGLSGDCRVLLFGYPQELRTNQTLVTGMHAFFQTLGIENPIFAGASDGGMVAQIYVQKYPGETGGLLADLMNQKPVTAENFAALAGKILLILPDQDFFSGKMQDDLKKLMHDPEVAYVSGGHLSMVVKADDYIRTIRAFLSR